MSPHTGKRIRMAAIAYTILLAAASLLPSGAGPLGGWDASISPDLQDALHLPAYTGLVILWALSWSALSPLSTCTVLAIACICIGFGAVMELAQYVIPGRTCSLGDGLVNALGVALGGLLMVVWRRLRLTPRTGAADGAPRKERARCESQ